jgi:hypothetical protein
LQNNAAVIKEMSRNTKKIRFDFKRIILLLAEKSFLFSIILIIIALLMGSYLFYNYYFLPIMSEPQVTESSLKINEQAYQGVLSEWEGRQKKFESADYKNYVNPFWNSEEKGE